MRRLAFGFWLVTAAACGEPRAASGPPSVPAPRRQPAEDSPATRLARGLADRPAPIGSGRNPFRFGNGSADAGSARRSPLPPLPPADGLPQLPLPLAPPTLRLLGVSTLEDGTRIASLLSGSELVLAREGEMIGGRFRIGRVTEDAVELTDAVGERPLRLTLR